MKILCNALIPVAFVTVSLAQSVQAQRIATVAPGSQYAASAAHERFFGAGYRALWQTPVRVDVLDIGAYAGGLEPVKEGGGRQTSTLHLKGRDGRQYVFRSVNKDADKVLPPGIEAFGVGSVVQDMTALFNPSSALILPRLMNAVSVLHASPRLYVMPDDPRLGEYRARFGGMLGYVEERPEEGPDNTSGFAGSKSIVNSEKIREHLLEDSRNGVDEREWLAARLIDFLVGDTDRGPNQWRWAMFDEGERIRWRPIPRDRDFAFIHADGLIPQLASIAFKRLARFEAELPPLNTLTFTALHDDRRFLQSLDDEMFAAVASDVRSRISDRVIEQAVRAMPPEHHALVGEDLAQKLRQRRAALPEIARKYYRQLAAYADVHASDKSELVEILRMPDGGVEVRFYQGPAVQVASSGDDDIVQPRVVLYTRRFEPDDTREIRLYLHGGDDRVLVAGPNTAEAIIVRIIAGPGTDELIDSSTDGPAGTRTLVYDDDRHGRVSHGRHTRIDGRAFQEPARPANPGLNGDKWRYRDWGQSSGWSPAIGFRANTGFLLGAQFTSRNYGFRAVPYASQWRAKALYAPGTGAFGGQLSGEEYFENSRFGIIGSIGASGYEDLRFYGYGNDSPKLDSDSARVETDRIHANAGIQYARGATRIRLGASMEIRDAPVESARTLAVFDPLGAGEWTQYGFWTSAEAAARRASIEILGAYHPVGASLREAYGKARAEGVVRIGTSPELALRAIGEKIWGDAPFFDAAFIGGRKSLRGYTSYRFAGDAAIIGNAELHVPVSGVFSLFVLGDAGRVYFDGESPGDWHTAVGGGAALTIMNHAINGIYAHGEDHKFYVTLGRTF